MEKTFFTALGHLIGVESLNMMGILCVLSLFDHPGRLLYMVTWSNRNRHLIFKALFVNGFDYIFV